MNSPNCQISTDKMCRERMLQVLANASKDLDVVTVDFNYFAMHAQQADQPAFSNKSAALAMWLQMFIRLEVLSFSKSVSEEACDVATSLQGDAAPCKATVGEGLSGWLVIAAREVVLVALRGVLVLSVVLFLGSGSGALVLRYIRGLCVVV